MQWAIQNLHTDFELVKQEGLFSVGLHPWFIDGQNLEQQLLLQRNYCTHQNVLAIGECGLDKICTTDFKLQQEVFIAQISLANKINKPLIIHCVRAWQEVMETLHQQHNKVPVVFHGYNKNLQLAQQIIAHGYYLSYGKALQQTRIQQELKALPIEQLFFETDDAALPIEKVYELAASALQIDSNSLCLQIKKNAAAVFGAANLFL